ncbi:Glucose-6-phosphate isomerase (GPI) [uncultured archaeon]|nr:Glucose-6-phosphate isomerase (GPI) [uncultured archaeon]
MGYSFDGTTLVFEGKRFTPSIRKFSEMKPVLAFPERAASLAPGTPTYFMYREAARFGTIRYDITLIPSLDLCGEHNKTFGHVHPKSPKGAFYTEAYEILGGEAHCLLQKASGQGIEDAVLLSAKKGDCLIVPPGYGHISINPYKKDLLMANLVSDSFKSDYSPYQARKGGCFYETTEGKFLPNKEYGTGFELRKEAAVKFSSAFGCFAPFKKQSLLSAAKDSRNLEFLEKPETFY